MIAREIYFLLPYLLGLALSLGIAVYVRKYRSVESARFFFYKVAAESLIIAGFILETVSRTLEIKILWDNIQLVLDLALPGLGYLFVMSIVKRRIRARAVLLVVVVPALIAAALVSTDSLHHLIRPAVWLNATPFFPELQYPYTSVQVALYAWILALMLVNALILFSFSVRGAGILRRQALVVCGALLIPLAGGLVSVLGLQVGPYRDISSVTLALQDLVIVVALARFALFDLVPVARDLAIEHMDVALFVEDVRNRIVDVNRSAAQQIRLAPQEIIGKDMTDVFPGHRELLERLRHVEEIVLETEGRRSHNIGRTFEVRISSARDHRGKKIGRIFLMQDITAHKKLAEALSKTRDELAARLAELERAQEELLRRERLSTLGQTVATVSHEMRNPLGSVRNALFSLREALAAGDRARSERAIELAERNVRRCDAIIMELLDYSRPRAPALEDLEVDAWLGKVLDELETPAGIEMTRVLKSHARARLDPERMRRAVVNVHSNAVQAMTAESGAGELTVESRSHDGRIELLFRDNGAGMSAEMLSRACEPLYSTKPYGVGLGLSIVKAVMQDHDGSLEIESSEGKGTVVRLLLKALP